MAELGEELVFVEVKTRRGTAFGTPEESITQKKAQRMVATAQHYLEQEGRENSGWRIDVVSIQLDLAGKLLQLNHLENAVEQ